MIREFGYLSGVKLKMRKMRKIGSDHYYSADSKSFFLMLSHNLESGDVDVKTLNNQRAGAEMVDILGDRYSARSMTKYLNLGEMGSDHYSSDGALNVV